MLIIISSDKCVKSFFQILHKPDRNSFGNDVRNFNNYNFIILAFIIGLTVYQIYKSSEYAIKTSIQESNEKYHIYDQVVLGKGVSDEGIDKYLSARDVHFSFTRKNSFKISVLTIFIQVILLGIGCYLILNNQLSVGQLVSAELIISGIFVSLVKLPKTLESVYDYETSQYKIAGAMKGHHHE